MKNNIPTQLSIFIGGVFYTKKTMKNYWSLEAHNYFTSGWVQAIYIHKPEKSSHSIMKANVKPSWRVTEECHSAWVSIKSDGTVLTAHCTCKAG